MPKTESISNKKKHFVNVLYTFPVLSEKSSCERIQRLHENVMAKIYNGAKEFVDYCSKSYNSTNFVKYFIKYILNFDLEECCLSFL